MSRGLPATIDPVRLADARARLSGELPLRAMARLRSVCLDDRGGVRLDLYFERGGEQGLRRMRGTITTAVHVVCQRCLQQMTLALRAEPSLIVVKAEERPDLAAANDGELLVADRPVSLSEIVEDELLLAMPMIPKHEPRECPGAPGQAGGPGAENPFAVLKRLKRGQK